jgi:ribosomal protein L21E
MMGESLANVGFSGGKYLLQTSYSELQMRRDAVIHALRNLTGSVQESYGPSDWQRGLDAFRQLSNFLETYAQGDLRALLVENELIRMMDNLIHRTGQGTVEGLRQLGATAKVDVERLRRLVIVGSRAVKPPSPPLTAFLDALQLFIDAFRNAGGYRLLHIARPPILFYGLYGQSVPGNESPERSIVSLVIQRGLLADQLDRFAQSGSGTRVAKGQIILDKLLYDTDRSIDLYAMGRAAFGEPEYRAAAYSYVIDVVTSIEQGELGSEVSPLNNLLRELTNDYGSTSSSSLTPISFRFQEIQDRLTEIRALLFTPLVSRLGSDPDSGFQLTDPPDPLPRLVDEGGPISSDPIIEFIQQELFIQKDMEQEWTDLVETMAPNYVPYQEVVGNGGVIAQLISSAIERVGVYANPGTSVPRDPASSWDEILRDGLRIRQ